MSAEQMTNIAEKQKAFFRTGRTKDIAFRREMLLRLKNAVRQNERALFAALREDLSKSAAEAYMTELSLVYQEIDAACRHLGRWSRPKRVKGTLGTFPARSAVYPEPYGVVLILAPWNYPVNLSLIPLVGALGAGNCAVLKCSRRSARTSALLQALLRDTFPEAYVCCVDADTPYDDVLRQDYDYIFFTGNARVGRQVMQAAAERLIPVSLELGGKSPCIVDRTANLRRAAKRIVWGKFLNAGQTCISIDYVLADNAVKPLLLQYMREEIAARYADAETRSDYPCIISQRHFDRLAALMAAETTVIGGNTNPAARKIAPAILPDADFDSPVMQEEIFGPLLPVIGYDDLDDAVSAVLARPKPLACYIFTEDRAAARRLLGALSFGGGCVNDVMLHISNHHLPFGGVGESGLGRYHGRYSFDTFSHKKSVVRNTTKVDLFFRYAPFDEKKLKFLQRWM